MKSYSESTTTATIQEIPEKKSDVPVKIVWPSVVVFAYAHLGALYAIYLMFVSAKIETTIAAFILYYMSGMGITAGAHRLWAHRCYKAKFPLRLFLAFLNTMAFQKDIYVWCRDHRAHHKFTETDADPHNVKRGFFFSHVGWLLCRKHPEVHEKGKLVEMSDLLQDPIVRFQKKWYLPLMLSCCFIFPTLLPVLGWDETYWNAFHLCVLFRYCITLNVTWFVNSAAHMWGNRPYDKAIFAKENKWVSFGALGEGFHNYHHTFPYDYSTSEFGMKLNITTAFIDLMALIGQAYDRKTVPTDVILRRVERTGDGSYIK